MSEELRDSQKVRHRDVPDYSTLKKGTILRQRFTEVKIRYIFVELTDSGAVTLIPIYTRKNTGEKWTTDLVRMFAVADDNEQFIEDFDSFDLTGFLNYLRTE